MLFFIIFFTDLWTNWTYHSHCMMWCEHCCLIIWTNSFHCKQMRSPEHCNRESEHLWQTIRRKCRSRFSRPNIAQSYEVFETPQACSSRRLMWTSFVTPLESWRFASNQFVEHNIRNAEILTTHESSFLAIWGVLQKLFPEVRAILELPNPLKSIKFLPIWLRI